MTFVNHETVLYSAAAAIFHLPHQHGKNPFDEIDQNIYGVHPSMFVTRA